MLTEVRIPAYDGWGFDYQKFNRRSEDWAMVAVSALVKKNGDTVEDVRVGLTNVALRAVARARGRGGAARPAGQCGDRSPEPPSRRPMGPTRRPI